MPDNPPSDNQRPPCCRDCGVAVYGTHREACVLYYRAPLVLPHHCRCVRRYCTLSAGHQGPCPTREATTLGEEAGAHVDACIREHLAPQIAPDGPRTRVQARRVTLSPEEAEVCVDWLRFYCDDEELGFLPHDEHYEHGRPVDFTELPDGWQDVYEVLAAIVPPRTEKTQWET